MFLPYAALVALLSAIVPQALAADVSLEMNITWVWANPDGMQWRPVIGINNQWPLPLLNFTKGDRVLATVRNQLGNQSTTVHWHGLFQNGTNYMDGVPMVTQCGIPTGSSMLYNFTLDQAGTYWYHSHTMGQYPDGLRQALVINDPENPYAGKYDEERIITLSDWYHDQMPGLLADFISYRNPTGAEPVPDSALMNDTSDFTMSVEPGKTYFIRLANIGAFASQYFWIQNHTMRIIEVDGVWTEEAETDMIYITAAQRYGILVTMKNDTSVNYPIVGSMDTDLFDTIPDTLNWNVTGWLVYDKTADLPAATDLDAFDPYDDFNLVPTDGMKLYGDADYTVTLDLTMDVLGDGANYAEFNDVTYTYAKVPTIYTALSAGANASDATVYGSYTNSFVLDYGDIIDIVLNNDDTGKHPFHLHGHNFQIISRSEDDAGHYNPANESNFPAVPSRRDTVLVRPTGNFVIRFKADNPGIWFFHCHIEWHMSSGLVATMVEAPLEIQKTVKPPQYINDLCTAQGVATSGNAAGNTEDFLDLKGQPEMPKALPAGFTAKGYVAMVFSCLAGVIGLASIAWYGIAPISTPIASS